MDTNQANRIAQNDNFQKRVNFLLLKQTLTTLLGTPDTPDILLGQKILTGNFPLLPWVNATLSADAIMAGAHSESGDTILDQQIVNQIIAEWPAFKM